MSFSRSSKMKCGLLQIDGSSTCRQWIRISSGSNYSKYQKVKVGQPSLYVWVCGKCQFWCYKQGNKLPEPEAAGYFPCQKERQKTPKDNSVVEVFQLKLKLNTGAGSWQTRFVSEPLLGSCPREGGFPLGTNQRDPLVFDTFQSQFGKLFVWVTLKTSFILVL